MLVTANRRSSARKFVFAAPFMLLSAACAPLVTPLAGQGTPQTMWTTSAQTGFADTFQLTLGGTFGDGPAWQNRVTTGLSNAFRTGDSISIYGSDSLDSPSHVNSWQAGFGYKTQVLKKGRHSLTLGSGLQHWRFPTVKTGVNDWLLPGTLLYQTKIHRLPFTVSSDSWTLLTTALPAGSLLHTQVWLQHNLYKRERLQVAFKHGPAHTYSWNFWGTDGNRVFRYQTMLVITSKNTSLEGGYRKQIGLQSGIHNNSYWQFALTRTFTFNCCR